MNESRMNLFLKARQLRQQQQQHNNTKEDLIRRVSQLAPSSSQVTDSKSSLTNNKHVVRHSTMQHI